MEYFEILHVWKWLFYICTCIMVYLVYNSRLEIISSQDLEGIVTCLLTFMLLWKSPHKFRIWILCRWHMFFSLAAVRDPLFVPEIWKFHNDRPCTGASSIVEDVCGLLHLSSWETFLDDLIFPCSGAPIIWMLDLLV